MLIEYKDYRPFVKCYKYNYMRKTKLNCYVKHIALNKKSEVYVCIKNMQVISASADRPQKSVLRSVKNHFYDLY